MRSLQRPRSGLRRVEVVPSGSPKDGRHLHNARRARKKKGLSRMMDSRLSALARAAFSSENLLRGKGEPVTVAVDAMGSDRAPKPEVEGAIQAAKLGLAKVILVGPEQQLRDELALHPAAARLPIEIVNATQVISMDEKAATAVRSKRDSSMRVGLRLVREGRAAGFITAGNTGAAMATAKMVLGALPGVDRPALAAVFPTAPGTAAILVDVGANVDCKPQNLEQFAIMGEIYSRSIFGKRQPRVGLLSIGEEETKGNALTREAYELLKHLP